MGINAGAMTLLLEESRRRPFSGSIVTLGRQTILGSRARIGRLLGGYGRTPPAAMTDGGNGVDDQALFQAMGFAEVVSLDASPFEGATRLLDLNAAETPPDLIGRFDVALDGGTLEHVFHIPNALAHLGRMVRLGGRIIHISPSSNFFDHGFYMFSPTLFFDYYQANGGRVDSARVIRQDSDGATWEVFDYHPRTWRCFPVGGLGGKAYLTFVVATAGETPPAAACPQQGYYRDAWRGGDDVPQGAVPARLRARLAALPGGLSMARRLRSFLRWLATGTVFGKRRLMRIRNE